MTKFVCVVKCFYDNRLYTPGMTVECKDGIVPPKHFKVVGGKPVEKKDEVKVKETLKLVKAHKVSKKADDLLE